MKERLGERLPRLELHPTSISLVVLDWSGVLSDDRKPVYEANMRVLVAHGKPTVSLDEWLSNTAVTPVEFFREHGIEGEPDELYGLYKRRLDEVVGSGNIPTVYPDAGETLRFLRDKGKRVAILSSHPTENLLREAQAYCLDQFFHYVLSSCLNKTTGLQEIYSILEEAATTTMYIGDTIHDIRAARQAGCHAAGIWSGYHSREMLARENPEVLFENLSEFRNWLQKT